MEKKCEKCNKVFIKSYFESRNAWNGRKYCSKSCANSVTKNGKGNKGKTSPNKGKKFPERSGENNPRYTRVKKICIVCGKEFEVKNYRKDTAKFCCKRCSEIDRDEGKSTEIMKIRKSIEYRLWREAVFARDNWTCQKCGIKGGKLHSHHIQNFAQYPEIRFAIDNGITLCEGCHSNFHKRYGIKNNTKEQMNEFLTDET